MTMSEQSTAPVGNVLLDDNLATRFPEYVSPDTRKGYEGYIVNADKLLDVATALRNEMGYDYLSSVTGVDYLPEGMLEVVYHAFKSTGGSGLVFKVQVPRENPVVPSLVPVYLGADLQEREAWDLLGIRFTAWDCPTPRRMRWWLASPTSPLWLTPDRIRQ